MTNPKTRHTELKTINLGAQILSGLNLDYISHHPDMR